jgi:serine/threonine-protein kinase
MATGLPADRESDAPTFDPAPRAAAVSRGGSRPASRLPGVTGSSEHATFEPGALLGDRYRIVALLGRGGMGEVYRADDLTLGQPVALKFLPAEVDRDAVRLDRLLGEVRTARQVSHPNVCRVYDIGEVEGRHFLSMEYIDGEDLASLLRRIGRLPADKGLEISRQLCAALAAAHDRGVLHRDLKPANVMLDGRGKVRLTDFGLAEAEGSHAAAASAGTPAYMAPEQFAGQPASVASDLYALGLVLYEIFSGKRAFEAPTLGELRRLHEESHAAQLSTSVHDLDPAIERVIFRCLEKSPSDRPASAMAVAAALPGGDPLAAALAAGETPSPDMVAAAGDTGAMRPRTAVAWLALALVGLMATLLAGHVNSALTRLPLDDSPDVSGFKARAMLERLGYPNAPVDWARGYQWDTGYADWVEGHDTSQGRWKDLASGHLLLRFWYRTAQSSMVPMRFFGGRLLESGQVRLDDPARDQAGMTFLLLDIRGRLLQFDAVPPAVDPEGAPPAPAALADWSRVVTETGLDPASLVTAAPRWTPLVAYDQRVAWTARYADLPALPVRLEAAAYRGKPVYVRVVMPWSRPDRAPARPSAGAAAAETLSLVVLCALLVGAVVFARRNVALGRGDRRGATRLAVAIGTIVLAALVLEGHHLASSDEIVVALRAICWTLFGAAFVSTLYLALEPAIRRRWPHTLIAWNRLLTGRLTDPLVGRSLLVGSATGAVTSVLAFAQDLAERQWAVGPPSSPGMGLAGPLLGWRMASSWTLLLVYDAIFSALAVFFLVFLLRLVLRKDWLAACGWAAVVVAQNALMNSSPWVAGVVSLFIVGSLMAVLFRSGILAFVVAMLVVTVLTQFPLTTDLTAWYGAGTVVAILLPAVLALYGFRVALAGKPLLGSSAD